MISNPTPPAQVASVAPVAPAVAVPKADPDRILNLALDFLWDPQRDGHQNDRAPTETFDTAWGVTQMTWDAAVKQGIVSGELRNATKAQCAAIYRANYWNALRCDELHPKVAFVAFCDATLMGVGRVIYALQECTAAALSLPPGFVDGRMGPNTVKQANRVPPDDLLDRIINSDEVYLQGRANAATYIRGWTIREEAERKAAHAIAA